MAFFNKPKGHRAHRLPGPHIRLQLEELESRTVPYVTTGNAWPNPLLITISFVPDGTILSSGVGGNVTSNLYSTFNSRFGSTAAWENQILLAAQSWAWQTNINFAVVSDSGAAIGSGNFVQENPTMGDIRIGGYNFNSPTLGYAYFPPPENNYSLAGDITFNTGQPFNIGSTYDLFTVAAHEFGHALGMDHTPVAGSVMFATYQGVLTGMSSDDQAGIRSIYSGGWARPYDPDRVWEDNQTNANAINISPLIDYLWTKTGELTNVDISTPTEIECWTFTAPAGTTGLTVTVQSQGLSLLAPKFTVYAANGTTVLGSANGLGQYGTSISTTVAATGGSQFYVDVQGADSSPFGTGDYAMTMKFASTNPAPVPTLSVPYLNGFPLQAGGGDPLSLGSPFPSPSGAVPFNPVIPVTQLNSGNPGIFGSSNTDPNTAYVVGVYQAVLGHPPIASQVSTYVSLLLNGATREQVAQMIIQSPEHREMEVNSYYQNFLNRTESPSEQAYWVQVFESGADEQTVVANFLNSQEYQLDHPGESNFFQAQYNDILGRSATAAEVSAWEAMVASGTSNQAVTQQILTSQESYKLALNGLFASDLNRAPDANALSWIPNLSTFQVSFTTIQAEILGDPGYQEFFKDGAATVQAAK